MFVGNKYYNNLCICDHNVCSGGAFSLPDYLEEQAEHYRGVVFVVFFALGLLWIRHQSKKEARHKKDPLLEPLRAGASQPAENKETTSSPTPEKDGPHANAAGTPNAPHAHPPAAASTALNTFSILFFAALSLPRFLIAFIARPKPWPLIDLFAVLALTGVILARSHGRFKDAWPRFAVVFMSLSLGAMIYSSIVLLPEHAHMIVRWSSDVGKILGVSQMAVLHLFEIAIVAYTDYQIHLLLELVTFTKPHDHTVPHGYRPLRPLFLLFFLVPVVTVFVIGLVAPAVAEVTSTVITVVYFVGVAVSCSRCVSNRMTASRSPPTARRHLLPALVMGILAIIMQIWDLTDDPIRLTEAFAVAATVATILHMLLLWVRSLLRPAGGVLPLPLSILATITLATHFARYASVEMLHASHSLDAIVKVYEAKPVAKSYEYFLWAPMSIMLFSTELVLRQFFAVSAATDAAPADHAAATEEAVEP